MKKLVVELFAQGLMALLVAGLAGFAALLVALPVGGTAFGVAPEAHINLVAGLMCPAGSEVVFGEGGDVVTNSGDGPSYGTAIRPMCEDASGVRTTIAEDSFVTQFFGILGLVMGGYFLICFAPLFLVGLIIGGILTHKLVGSLAR